MRYEIDINEKDDEAYINEGGALWLLSEDGQEAIRKKIKPIPSEPENNGMILLAKLQQQLSEQQQHLTHNMRKDFDMSVIINPNLNFTEEELQERWNKICPPLYRDTDVERLRVDSKITDEKFNTIRNWEFSHKGLLLHGTTGRGKTRFMYLLLKKYFFKGYRIKNILVNQFAVECITAFTNGTAMEWIDNYYKVHILFLDDFGNQKFTDRMEDSLFSIIETRNANMLPTMVTSNYTGDTLKEKISGDRADAILRRLREFSISVSL